VVLQLGSVVEAEDDGVEVEVLRLVQIPGRVAGGPDRRPGIDRLGLSNDLAEFLGGMAALGGFLGFFAEVIQVQADDLLVGERKLRDPGRIGICFFRDEINSPTRG